MVITVTVKTHPVFDKRNVDCLELFIFCVCLLAHVAIAVFMRSVSLDLLRIIANERLEIAKCKLFKCSLL